MLFSTSLVAVVGSGSQPTSSQRRLRILNTKKKTNICELTFPSAILAVKLNRKRLVVVLLDQIYIYDISCMKLLHTIETLPNPRGVCDLSSNDDSILVYPAASGSTDSPFHKDHGNDAATGTVLVFDALNIAPLNIVQAHRSPLACIALNSNGSLLATASSKGTIVRVFSTLSGTSIGQFRRGSYSAVISILVFRPDSHVLAVGSETGTVHLFRLAEDGHPKTELDSEDVADTQEHTLPQLLRSTSSGNATSPTATTTTATSPTSATSGSRKLSITQTLLRNLPKNITSMLEPERDFAYLKLSNATHPTTNTNSGSSHSSITPPARPGSPVHSSQTIGFSGPDVVVANYADASLSVYSVPSAGGECVLTKQYSLLG
jgi:autophagy-related protein 18